jgi:cytochrome bd ubiquinol oxidase subunit I
MMVAGITGSFMVISVNGWMNQPTGFSISNGEVVDVKPIVALFNDNLWHELTHMYIAGFIVAGFLVAGVYAYGWLRGRRDRHHRVGLVVALTVAALATPAQLLVGDWAARTVAVNQPTKLAVLEGLPETESGAPLHILGIYEDGEVKYGIKFPKLLSLLAFHEPNATVQGLDAAGPNGIPTDTGINIVRLAFQAMVFIGTFMAAVGAFFLWNWWRKRRLPESVWFMRALVVVGPLSVVALISGWVTTEVGRQPWVVYEVMRTEDAVTGAGGIPIGYATLVIVYLSLAAIAGVMLRRLARKPMEA